ncbi:MAG: leucine-rich repeat domain-containing protein, partial [Muribaculaceae bacterium]|nr:leucine-rich repeat domain-containing protein [Muribaculaceae bacterium]
MKKLLLFMLGVLMALPAFAQDFTYEYEGQTLIYTVISEEEKTVETKQGSNNKTPGNKVTGDLVIPETVKNGETEYSVTTIGTFAFAGCSGLNSVTVPESVTSIGECAFYSCRFLHSVLIHPTVITIGNDAFKNCVNISKAAYPNTISNPFDKVDKIGSCIAYDPEVTIIEDGWVYGPNKKVIYYAPVKLQGEYSIPESVETICDYAFSDCSGLTSINIPESVTSIGAGAFSDCSGLTSINIPESVTSIGESTFSGCSGLTSIDIPESVTSIGDYAFLGCRGLISIDIPESVTFIGDGTFHSCSSLTSIAIPESVSSIGDYAFDGCSSLTSIVIPESVTSIGLWAFFYCSSLISINIPNTVTSIGNAAFRYCSSLTSINIPNSVTSIGGSVFADCSGLTSIDIPNSVNTIGEYAFYGCSGLTSIVIPESVTSIGNGAFYGCNGLTSVLIPPSVTTLGDEAFMDCNSIYKAAYPNTFSNPFDQIDICIAYDPKDAVVDNGVLYGSDTNTLYFASLTLQGEYSIPESVETVGDKAFYGCTGLTSIIIPESVTSIGNDAFRACPLYRVAIFNPDITIESGAFDESLPISCLFCPEEFDASSIYAHNIIRFNPEGGITFLEDGTVLGDNGETLLKAPMALTLESYNIPDGVVTIKSKAFKPDEMLSVDERASWGSITIPSSVAIVEADAFRFIDLERVNFVDWPAWYENVQLGNLESNPYRNCGAYAGGVKITAPELKEGMTEIKDYVNYGLLPYKDEVELPSTLKRIGAYAFYNNTELYSVILPDGLEEIGESAFEGCGLLENQTFPASLKKIEDAAYRGSSLTEVELPEGLNSLGNAVFAGCGI